mmetsp:Transcript_37331/g.83062  ORF Transcript_37331/g.83062 Transcript_37331/m.83062 type:complete len:106 (-) Transcript_37331:1268-1585(-)
MMGSHACTMSCTASFDAAPAAVREVQRAAFAPAPCRDPPVLPFKYRYHQLNCTAYANCTARGSLMPVLACPMVPAGSGLRSQLSASSLPVTPPVTPPATPPHSML